MTLQSIKYAPGKLEILDQLLLPVQSKYLAVKGVEDGWKVINKMQVSLLKQKYYFLETICICNIFYLVNLFLKYVYNLK